MPGTGDSNKTAQSPGIGPSKSNNKAPAAGDKSGSTGNHKRSSSEVPQQHKKRGVPTPNSLMVLHRRGYVLDGGTTLGTGAYAKVKVGTSLKMNIQVAIKIVNKLATPKEVVERFLPREIETMKAVSNEHVIKLYEVIETPETIFFIMELADKGDLLDFINERKYLSERLARGFFSDLVQGIDHCHTRGVVHRDLKCENLLLDSHMRLKITDFGFARKFDGNLKTFCGSFAYAAPEVILGNPYNGPLADIWSMGVILYAMVTGRLPFKDTSTSVLMADIAAGVKFSSRHTEKLRSLINKILTFLPQDRADMEYIQGHPWMCVPLSINFPQTSAPKTTSDEKQVSNASQNGPSHNASQNDPSHNASQNGPSKEDRANSNDQSQKQSSKLPSISSKSKSRGKPGSAGASRSRGSSRNSSASSKERTKSPTKNETLCVPNIGDNTTTDSKTKSRRGSVPTATVPPTDVSKNKIIIQSKSITFPDVYAGSNPCSKKPPQPGTNDWPQIKSRESSIKESNNSGHSVSTSGSGIPSRILDTRYAFHSASRYEKGEPSTTSNASSKN